MSACLADQCAVCKQRVLIPPCWQRSVSKMCVGSPAPPCRVRWSLTLCLCVHHGGSSGSHAPAQTRIVINTMLRLHASVAAAPTSCLPHAHVQQIPCRPKCRFHNASVTVVRCCLKTLVPKTNAVCALTPPGACLLVVELWYTPSGPDLMTVLLL